MSPTLSDDLLVRDLHERADRLLPTMALDPADVLVAGRRHRRRQTALRSVGGFAVAAVAAVGALQLADGPTETAPADPDIVQIDETLSIRVARDVEVIETDVGPAADLGLTVYDLDFADPTQALRYVVARAEFDGGPGIDVRVLDVDGSSESQGAAGPLGTQSDPRNPMLRYGETGDQGFQALGAVPAGLDGATFELVVARDAGDARIPLPTFTVPGLDGNFFFFLLHDERVPFEDWPTVYVELTAPDGTASRWGLDGQELEASGADAPAIQVAENVRVIETDTGPATDLGVTVKDPQLLDPNQALRYIISVTTVGEMAPEAAGLTPEELAGPAVLLSTLAADGTTSAEAGGDLATSRATSDGSPMYQSGLSDHDVYVLGRLSPGSGATLELVVEHAEGAERTLIPAFRLPGLPDDFFFVALHHDKVTFADWPTIYLELTAQDGATRQWTLAGIELSEDVPKPTDVPADQG